MVPPCSDRISRVPPYSRIIPDTTHTGLSPAMAGLSIPFCFFKNNHWPVPRSLATTSRISIDVFSSGYLDVSVPRVRLMPLCIQDMIPIAGWVSPFRYPRIKACSRLPMAFRSVPRLSSPPGAKASTECPYRAHCPHMHRSHPLKPTLQYLIAQVKNCQIEQQRPHIRKCSTSAQSTHIHTRL